jgi:hypothetical protein
MVVGRNRTAGEQRSNKVRTLAGTARQAARLVVCHRPCPDITYSALSVGLTVERGLQTVQCVIRTFDLKFHGLPELRII